MNEKVKESRKATPVQDLIAENRIKWGVVAQTIIIAAIVGVGSFAIRSGERFGDRVIDGIDKINQSIDDVKQEISNLNSGQKINSLRIDNMETSFGRRFDHIEDELSSNTKFINRYFGGKYEEGQE